MLAWNTFHRSASRLAAAGLVFAVLAGCSADRSVFESTPFRQARVEVIDTVERETVWSMDVPVNQKLVIDLEHEGGNEREGFSTSDETPDMLKWWLYPSDASQKFTAGYYYGSPLDQGEFDIQSQAIMLRYSIIPREDEVPTAEPPASSPPAPRSVEPPRDTDRDTDPNGGTWIGTWIPKRPTTRPTNPPPPMSRWKCRTGKRWKRRRRSQSRTHRVMSPK